MIVTWSERINSAVLKNPSKFLSEIHEVFYGASLIVLREYKQQVPVMKGELRRNVTVISSADKNDIRYITTVAGLPPIARGMNRAELLHEGTGVLRGYPDFGYTTGHVRAGTVAKGAGGIRPNRFADRTRKNVESKVYNFIFRELNKVI